MPMLLRRHKARRTQYNLRNSLFCVEMNRGAQSLSNENVDWGRKKFSVYCSMLLADVVSKSFSQADSLEIGQTLATRIEPSNFAL
jgi:hypothetical protein